MDARLDLLADLLALDPTAQGLLARTASAADLIGDDPVPPAMVERLRELARKPLQLTLPTGVRRTGLLRHLAEPDRPTAACAPLLGILAADLDCRVGVPEAAAVDEAVWESSAMFNAALQVAYFLMGVRTAGLAAGPVSGFDRAGIADEFFPNGRIVPLCVVSIGRPVSAYDEQRSFRYQNTPRAG